MQCRRSRRAVFADVSLPGTFSFVILQLEWLCVFACTRYRFAIILSFIGQKSAKAEVEPGKTEQRSVADYYDADYWKEFLASQLDFLNVSSECADTESKDVVALKDASVECNSAVCDANTESADCHPSLSPAVSSCSESDSSAQSLSEPSPSKQKFVRRAPGSLRIEEVFSEAEARKSSKGYNVKLVKEIRIEDGSTGYGYDKLFVDALNSRLRSVFVNDPYIRLKSQASCALFTL
uniref:Rab-GAP TBC domain-containing protein n=1 Tax=Ascaris lumbricoides TaxID=6252 RepID=A0A0M3ITB8_ASCLU